MAGCSSAIDTSVFMRWRPPPAEEVLAADAASGDNDSHRREQLRQEFRRHFGKQQQQKQALAGAKGHAASPAGPTIAAAGAKPTQPQSKRKPQQQQRQKPQPLSSRRPAPVVPRDVGVHGPPGLRKLQLAAADSAAATELRHLRLLSPATRANRSMHTTWHHLPPNPDTSRGNCRASHFATSGSGGGGGGDCGHYRIHPDWGWDAPPCPSDEE